MAVGLTSINRSALLILISSLSASNRFTHRSVMAVFLPTALTLAASDVVTYSTPALGLPAPLLPGTPSGPTACVSFSAARAATSAPLLRGRRWEVGFEVWEGVLFGTTTGLLVEVDATGPAEGEGRAGGSASFGCRTGVTVSLGVEGASSEDGMGVSSSMFSSGAVSAAMRAFLRFSFFAFLTGWCWSSHSSSESTTILPFPLPPFSLVDGIVASGRAAASTIGTSAVVASGWPDLGAVGMLALALVRFLGPTEDDDGTGPGLEGDDGGREDSAKVEMLGTTNWATRSAPSTALLGRFLIGELTTAELERGIGGDEDELAMAFGRSLCSFSGWRCCWGATGVGAALDGVVLGRRASRKLILPASMLPVFMVDVMSR